jgi:hypothetical protein
VQVVSVPAFGIFPFISLSLYICVCVFKSLSKVTMSSNQPPQQAGRFKPRKAATLKASSLGKGGGSDTVTTTTTTNNNNTTASNMSAVEASVESNLQHEARKQKSQAMVRNSKGGRGGNRGSAKNNPKGQVFFTGTAKSHPPPNHRSKNKNIAITSSQSSNFDSVNLKDRDSSNSVLSRLNSDLKSTGNIIGRTAQERVLASAIARRGEGEEVIIGTLDHHTLDDDSDDDSSVKSKGKKNGVLTPTRNKQYDSSNDYHHHDDDYYPINTTNNECDYTYDSDSSQDERQYDESYTQSNTTLHPQRLPFPPPRTIGTQMLEPLYACQSNHKVTSSDKGKSNPKLAQENFIYTDPPPTAPFHVLNNQDDKKEEQASWMLFKFPTRLPRLAPHCITTSNASGKSRIETSNMTTKDSSEPMNSDQGDPRSHQLDAHAYNNAVPDAVSSSFFNDDSTEINHSSSRNSNTSSTSNNLYDDLLKDASAGRYGKIVVHKSGKAYLVVGGTDSKTPQVRMSLQNGLSCGFQQQAVSIHTSTDGKKSGSYIPLGEVNKTIVVTPDVESAFL